MNRLEYRNLLGERTALERMLAATPSEDVLDRGSLAARLEDVQHRLAAFSGNEREPARARVTFRGAPVVDSLGIAAEFGTKAVNSFTESVIAMAASLSGPLAATGRIPNRDQNQLLITGTAVGSFGFELEERGSEEPGDGDTAAVSEALELTRELLHATLGSDEELAESASATDRRALDNVRRFLKTLVDNEAVCTVQVGDAWVRFTDVGQVRTSFDRLSPENVHEFEEVIAGQVLGVLPSTRVFEFRRNGEDKQVLKIKVGATIPDATVLNERLNKPIQIKVNVTRVGNGRPRYTLLEWPAAAGS